MYICKNNFPSFYWIIDSYYKKSKNRAGKPQKLKITLFVHSVNLDPNLILQGLLKYDLLLVSYPDFGKKPECFARVKGQKCLPILHALDLLSGISITSNHYRRGPESKYTRLKWNKTTAGGGGGKTAHEIFLSLKPQKMLSHYSLFHPQFSFSPSRHLPSPQYFS